MNPKRYTVEPLIMNTLKSGQPPYNGQTVHPPACCPYISTSEEGTTSEQWTKHSSQMCPLFGGSTEVNKYSLHQKLRQHYQREGVLGYVVD